MDEHEIRAAVRRSGEELPPATRASIREAVEAELGGTSNVRPLQPPLRRRAWIVAAVTIAVAAAIVGLVLLQPDRRPGQITVDTGPATAPGTTTPSTTVLPTTAPVTTVPTPTTTLPVPPAPANVALPEGFTVSSMSWPSSTDGWMVGWPKDAVGPPSLVHTADGGTRWVDAAAPANPAQEWHQILFADETNGWLLGDHLYSTHDGGATWTPAAIAGQAAAAATAGRTVHVLHSVGEGRGWTVADSPIDHDAFADAAGGPTIPQGAGPVLDAGVTAGGPYAAAWYNDRGFIGGVELRGGTWQPWMPTCPDPGAVPVVKAELAPDGSQLALACAPSGFGDLPASIYALDHSDDSMRPLPGADHVADRIPRLDFVAATSRHTMLAVYDGKVATSTDAGHTWTVTHSFADGVYPGAHGEVPGVGYAIATGPGTGILSRDGGITWSDI
jgi:photosystem II stability/assembly factor-like uncharacterized protein